MKNVRPFERFLRAAVAVVLFETSYFWLGSPWNWICFGLGAILLLTAIMGIWPLYRLLGIESTPAKQQRRPLLVALAALLLAALVVGGAYGSMFFSRKLFLADFNAMNAHYKQALFLTGKGDRQGAVSNFDALLPAFAAFSTKYGSYRPYALKSDAELASNFNTVRQILLEADPLVRTGDLHEAHLSLEKVRPVFQSMFKRNGFSMLSVALVDFHDAMETILTAASAKDAAGVTSLYPSVSEKLRAVENEDNDAEVQDIRKALDDVLATAQTGNGDALPAKGDTLKSSFIKVYLKRG